MVKEFIKSERGFDFLFSETVPANNDAFYVKVPDVSKNKRSLSDIGFSADDDVVISATLEEDIENATLWKTVNADESLNKTITGFKIDNSANSFPAKVVIRIIFES